jgi:putative acetyltransferase
LTDELREDPGFLPHLSLVAVVDGAVIGHVLATRGWLEPLAVPARDLGVRSPDPRWREHFQARQLSGAPVTGTFRYAAPFDRL